MEDKDFWIEVPDLDSMGPILGDATMDFPIVAMDQEEYPVAMYSVGRLPPFKKSWKYKLALAWIERNPRPPLWLARLWRPAFLAIEKALESVYNRADDVLFSEERKARNQGK